MSRTPWFFFMSRTSWFFYTSRTPWVSYNNPSRRSSTPLSSMNSLLVCQCHELNASSKCHELHEASIITQTSASQLHAHPQSVSVYQCHELSTSSKCHELHAGPIIARTGAPQHNWEALLVPTLNTEGFLGMVWLRWVGALKLYVSFAEYSLFYTALLQKRHIILRSLLIVATPYANVVTSLKRHFNLTNSTSLSLPNCV